MIIPGIINTLFLYINIILYKPYTQCLNSWLARYMLDHYDMTLLGADVSLNQIYD